MCELTLEAAAMGTSKTIKVDGYTFYVHIERDNDMAAPWIEHDGHGLVIKEIAASLAPRGARHMAGGYYYDWRATLAIAKRDGWGLGPQAMHELALKLGREPTKNEVLDYAVERDFEYCRDWLLDRWEWVYIAVHLTDITGRKVPGDDHVHYMGGLEDDDAYIESCARELAQQIIVELDGKTELTVRLK